MEKTSILNTPVSEWPSIVAGLGEQPFRAAQLVEWVYKKRETQFSKMGNLPAALREKLEKKNCGGAPACEQAPVRARRLSTPSPARTPPPRPFRQTIWRCP